MILHYIALPVLRPFPPPTEFISVEAMPLHYGRTRSVASCNIDRNMHSPRAIYTPEMRRRLPAQLVLLQFLE